MSFHYSHNKNNNEIPFQTVDSFETKNKQFHLQVRPVLKRADSVKLIGAAVLDNRVSTYAADRIDGALDVADKYVDKYLPSNATDQVDCECFEFDSTM